MEEGFWVTQKNMFWNMFSFVFLGFVSTWEVVEILMKSKSCSPWLVINGSWNKPSISEYFTPCLSRSAVRSPRIAFLRGRNAGWTCRTRCSRGSRLLSFTSHDDTALLFQQTSLGMGFWTSTCATLTGKKMSQLFICLHPAHCRAIAEMLLPLCSPGIRAGAVGAVCSCLHVRSHVTTQEQHLFALSSP